MCNWGICCAVKMLVILRLGTHFIPQELTIFVAKPVLHFCRYSDVTFVQQGGYRLKSGTCTSPAAAAAGTTKLKYE